VNLILLQKSTSLILIKGRNRPFLHYLNARLLYYSSLVLAYLFLASFPRRLNLRAMSVIRIKVAFDVDIFLITAVYSWRSFINSVFWDKMVGQIWYWLAIYLIFLNFVVVISFPERQGSWNFIQRLWATYLGKGMLQILDEFIFLL